MTLVILAFHLAPSPVPSNLSKALFYDPELSMWSILSLQSSHCWDTLFTHLLYIKHETNTSMKLQHIYTQTVQHTDTNLYPRRQGYYFRSRCVQWSTRRRPSNGPAGRTWTWAGWGPQRCTGSNDPASVGGARGGGGAPSSAGEPRSSGRERSHGFEGMN